MRYYLFFFLIFFNIAYSSGDMVSKEASVIEKKYKLIRTAVGSYGPYKGYSFDYNSGQELSIEEARKLIVKYASDLQKATGIFDFTQGFEGEKDGKQSLWIHISFVDKDREYFIKDNTVSQVELMHGNLEYKKYIPKTSYLKTIFEESYAEALKIISTNLLKKTN